MMTTSPDLRSVLSRVTDAVENLPCGAEHSCSAQLRRDLFALRERVRRAGRPSGDLLAEAEGLLGRISEYLAATGPAMR